MSRLPWKHLAAVAVLFFLYFFRLDGVGLHGPDEPRYAAIGREMEQSGDWVTPRLWGKPWFEKPALLYWMTAGGYRTGLGDDLSPRLPVALLSAAFLFFYFHQLRREFGQAPALYASIMLASSAGWLAYGQTAVTDAPLAATSAAAMLLCLPWIRSGGRRGLTAGGVVLGLAILAKGLVPIVLVAPLLWFGRRRWKDLLIFSAAALAVSVPWYWLCWQQNGAVFLDELFWKHHFARFATAELQHVQPFWFYLPVFAGLLFPWTPIALLLCRRMYGKDARLQFLAAVLVFGLVFFSLSQNKLPGYLLPLLPVTFALAGVALERTGRLARWLLPVCAGLTAFMPVAASLLPEAMRVGLRASSLAAFPAVSIAIALAVVPFSIALARRDKKSASLLTAMMGMVAGVIWTKVEVYPRLDRSVSARNLWQQVSAERDSVCIGDVNRAWQYGLNFYGRTNFPACDRGRGVMRIAIEAGPDEMPLVVRRVPPL